MGMPASGGQAGSMEPPGQPATPFEEPTPIPERPGASDTPFENVVIATPGSVYDQPPAPGGVGDVALPPMFPEIPQPPELPVNPGQYPGGAGPDFIPPPTGITDLAPPPDLPINSQQYPAGTGPEYIPPPQGITELGAPAISPPELVPPPDLPPEYQISAPGEAPPAPPEQPAIVDTAPYPAPSASLPANPFDQPLYVDPAVFQNRYDLVYGQAPANPADPNAPPDAGSTVFGPQLDPNLPVAPGQLPSGDQTPVLPAELAPPTPDIPFVGPPSVVTPPSGVEVAPSGFPVGSYTPDPVAQGGPIAGSFGYYGLGGGGPTDVTSFGGNSYARSIIARALSGNFMSAGQYGQYLAQAPSPFGGPQPSYATYVNNMRALAAAVRSNPQFAANLAAASPENVSRGTPPHQGK